jgi:hypothetical protein
MASAWRIECPPCRWIGFTDVREDADRMAAEHVNGAREKAHAVTIEPGAPEPRRRSPGA